MKKDTKESIFQVSCLIGIVFVVAVVFYLYLIY